MVYVHYNIPLWVRQLEKILDVNAISLEDIGIMFEWRVQCKMPIMKQALK
jgi:hypothetical protein